MRGNHMESAGEAARDNRSTRSPRARENRDWTRPGSYEHSKRGRILTSLRRRGEETNLDLALAQLVGELDDRVPRALVHRVFYFITYILSLFNIYTKLLFNNLFIY